MVRLPVSLEIREYAQRNSNKESLILQELKRITQNKTKNPGMLSGQINGKFFKMLCNLIQAKKVLEIGTFTGYTALSMAEGIPESGKVITCDVDEESTRIAREYWNKSPHGNKIELKLGNAVETVSHISGPIDFVFIDADKHNYPTYWELVVPKVRSGGVIAIDNVFLRGGVLDPTSKEHKIMNEFNKMVKNDPRVDVIMLTLRDGVTLAQKL